jgi:hypothetical protein
MKSIAKDFAAVAAVMAACLPYAVAASAWSGDSAGGVLLWIAIGLIYGCCLGEALVRFTE